MIVDTTAGKVQGLQRPSGLQFRGIPYARAERFRPPEPPPPWPGVRDAIAFGPPAPQNPSPTEAMLGMASQDGHEDCLVLNVYTPAADDRRRPVMVWIHGGGFTAGRGHLPIYNGTNLSALGDVVVVTINYRLGALGFLHLDEVLDGYAGSGSNGLRDQVAALHWVRDNIAGFGGDPDLVTIFGQSAGSMSVAGLMASPDAAGLFHRAIAQSGCAERFHRPETAVTVTEMLLDKLGLDRGSAHRLLDLGVEPLLAAQATIEGTMRAASPDADPRGLPYLALPFQPVLDGAFLPADPLAAVAQGSAAGVPLVVGTTRDEWNLFVLTELGGAGLGEDRLRRLVTRLVGPEHADATLAAYREARPGADATARWSAIAADWVFRLPAIRLAEAQLPHAPHIAMYRFDYPSQAFGGAPGACHAVDLPFVFGNVDARGMDLLLGGVDDGTRGLADRMSRAWLAAARTGRPSHAGLPWPDYDLRRRATCLLDRQPAVVDDPDGRIRDFWTAMPTQP